MNDLNDCFDEQDFAVDEFDDEFDRLEREEAEEADRSIDDEETRDYE